MRRKEVLWSREKGCEVKGWLEGAVTRECVWVGSLSGERRVMCVLVREGRGWMSRNMVIKNGWPGDGVPRGGSVSVKE